MDFFDERVLAALKDGKPKGFTALLGEVGFSHNTLLHHLERLAGQGFVVRRKRLQTVLEDPNTSIRSAKEGKTVWSSGSPRNGHNRDEKECVYIQKHPCQY